MFKISSFILQSFSFLFIVTQCQAGGSPSKADKEEDTSSEKMPLTISSKSTLSQDICPQIEGFLNTVKECKIQNNFSQIDQLKKTYKNYENQHLSEKPALFVYSIDFGSEKKYPGYIAFQANEGRLKELKNLIKEMEKEEKKNRKTKK